MANRYRAIRPKVSFTEDEYAIIQSKMLEGGYHNFSLFAREMLLTGMVKHYDFSTLREVSGTLSRLAGSINQVAKRCNETKSIYTDDVKMLQRDYMEVKSQIQERLVKLIRKL